MTDSSPVPFEELYAQRQWVRALAMRLVRDPGAADDVEQQTWIAAIEHPPRRGSVRAWLGTVVRSKAWKLRRSGERRARHEETALPRDAERRPEEVVAAAEAQRRVVDAVMSLDEPYRATVLLRYFEDVTPTEIARRLGVPVDTVKTRLRRAVEILRARLEGDHGGDRRAWAVAILGADFGRFDPGVRGSAVAATVEVAAMATMTKVILAAAAVAVVAGVWIGASGTETSAPKATPDGSGHAPETSATTASGPRHAAGDRAVPPEETVIAPVVAPVPEIDRALDLHGEVVGTDGAPISGATLTADDTVASSPTSRLDVPPARTGADGRFVIRLRPGDVGAFIVEAAGFARLRIPSLQAGEHARIVLPRAVRLRVAVTGSDGAPAAGVTLNLWPVVEPWKQATQPHVPRGSAVTGEDGSATFADLLPGAQVRVNAWPRRRDAPHSGVVVLPATGDADLPLQLAAAETIRGRVTDVRNGSGVAARITLTNGIGADRSVTVATDGTFELDGDRPGVGVWLRVDAAGFVSQSVGYIGNKDAAALEIGMRPAGTVTLRCVDESGAPIAGVRVFVSAPGPVLSQFDAMRSGADGRMRLDGLDPKTRSTVMLLHEDLAPATVNADFPAETFALDLGDVRLTSGTEVAGRVLRADGTPVARAVVLVRGGAVPSAQQRCADDLGRFRFPHVGPGDRQVGAADSGLPNRFRIVRVATEPVDVTLVVESPRELRIEAVDARGLPLAGCEFTVQDAGQNRTRVTTGADGAGSVPVTGRASVQFVPGATPLVCDRATRLARPSQATARFTLRPAGHATGVVVGPDGALLAKCLFDVRIDGAHAGRFSTDAKGAFDVVLPVGGTSSLEILGVQGAVGTTLDDAVVGGRFELTPGAPDVVLRATPVAKTGTLTVRVLDPAGAPVAGAKVLAMAVSSRAEAVSDADGRVHLDGLPVRELDVFASPLGAWQGSIRLRETPQGQELTLRLRGTTVVTGRVVDEGGKPVHRASVMAEAAASDVRWNASTDADGAFRVELPSDVAGPLCVNVQHFFRGTLYDVFAEDVAPGTTGLAIVLR